MSRAWSPIMKDGKPDMVVSVSRDMTAQIKAHEDLQKAYELQREFLNNVTHEVRTPLTAIQGYAMMMLEGLEGQLTKGQADLLGKVLTSSENLLEIVNGVLEAARMRSGTTTLRPKISNPGLVVEKVVSAVLPQAEKKGLNIRLNAPVKTHSALYDEDKLIMILTNLLSNAVKFTEQGEIEIILTASQKSSEIIIVDSGSGIAQSDIGNIFDEFQQFDFPGKHKPVGFGLGLAIVASIVEIIGGSLTVSSDKGCGTAFTLWVPALEA